MIIKSVNLETVCGITSKIPDNIYPEVAFAGKSNVGKSSLINTLMNRKSLARISSQPGKTQTINFYNINETMYLVDLPGYGYANANEEIKAKWGRMIENYLHTSKQLVAVFLLIDIRHDPSDNDRLMYDWMQQQGYAPIIIATKADKLKRSQVDAHVRAIREGLCVQEGTVIIPFSAETHQGREDVWNLIEELARLTPAAEMKAQNTTVPATGNPAEAVANQMPGEAATAMQPDRKPRWKATGKPIAKKTLRNAARKEKKQGKRK